LKSRRTSHAEGAGRGAESPSGSVFGVVLLKEAVGTQLLAVSFDIISTPDCLNTSRSPTTKKLSAES
jgi:hypothetical protein